MITLYLIVPYIIILFVASILLFEFSKLFKVPRVTYAKSLMTALATSVIFIEMGNIPSSINFFVALAIKLAVTYGVFHLIFQKFYRVAWKKSLSVCASYLIVLYVLLYVALYFFFQAA